MSALLNKPVFELKLHFYGVKNFIKVNGVSILKTLDSDGQLTTTLPLNHWMRSGKNTIGFVAYSREPGEEINSNAVLNISLWVRQHGVDHEGFKIADIDFKAAKLGEKLAIADSSPSGTFDSKKDFASSENGDVHVQDVLIEPRPGYEGAYTITRELNIPSSLPLWAFFNSDDLPDYDSMPDEPYYEARDKIYDAVYKPVQDALASGNIDKIMPLFEERNREIDQAFYLEPGSTGTELRESMLEAINDPDYVLADLPVDFVIIRVEDNRKLVSLLRNGDTTAVGFDIESISSSESYPIQLRRQDDKWIITR